MKSRTLKSITPLLFLALIFGGCTNSDDSTLEDSAFYLILTFTDKQELKVGDVAVFDGDVIGRVKKITPARNAREVFYEVRTEFDKAYQGILHDHMSFRIRTPLFDNTSRIEIREENSWQVGGKAALENGARVHGGPLR